MHIIIFKTSVATLQQVRKIQLLFNRLPLIIQSNFDLEDSDRILRIVSKELQPQAICNLLQTEGFNCETLESFAYPQ
ncbi:hypothetical protein ACSBL2_12275 [Pedobacter sp. AW31-3R]|uniref:hypothetical protein n=1 Tax=Pedobacter sp. AW31-3R TaxID=3445781 RepID=UPI003FA106AF